MCVKIQVLNGMFYNLHETETIFEMEELLFRRYYAHAIYPISIGYDGDKFHDVQKAMDLSHLKEFLDLWPKSDCYGMMEIPLDDFEDVAESRRKKFSNLVVTKGGVKMEKVGLYFYVNGDVIMEAVPIDEGIMYGELITFEKSHFDVWEESYIDVYHHEYDYFPRGRVVYKQRDNQFILYIDNCIDIAGKNKILKMFGIDNKEVVLVDDDFHYVCHECNEFYMD